MSLGGKDQAAFMAYDPLTGDSAAVLYSGLMGGLRYSSFFHGADLCLDEVEQSRYLSFATPLTRLLSQMSAVENREGFAYIPAAAAVNGWFGADSAPDPVTFIASAIALSGAMSSAVDSPSLTDLDIAPGDFSPNGDNVKDTLTVTGLFTREANWTLTVTDSNGALRRTITGSGWDLNTSWDGKNDSGTLLPDGTYTLKIAYVDALKGKPGPDVTRAIRLDTTAPVAIISSPSQGAPVIGIGVIKGTASDPNLDSWVLEAGQGQSPTAWTRIYKSFASVSDQSLAVFNSELMEDGLVTLRLTVLDTAGNRSQALRQVNVTNPGRDTIAPLVSITSPAPGAVLTEATPLTLTATDNVGVTKTEFYVDGNLLATDVSTPYEFTFHPSWFETGSRNIKVKAYDLKGNVGEDSVSVTGASFFSELKALPDPFSPNSDAVDDTVSITASLASSAPWTLSVVNSSQTIVSVFSGLGSALSVSWDGKDTGGTVVPDGIYTIALQSSGHPDALIPVTVETVDKPPVLEISSPESEDRVTGNVEIVGTVKDGNLSQWKLFMREGETGEWEELKSGAAMIQNALLGEFDSTIKMNGRFELRLWAKDTGNNENEILIPIYISGQRKIGNFEMSFTDVLVPLQGIPIEITRTYRSIDKSTRDFGVGWQFSYNANMVKDSDENMTLTLPDGRRETFMQDLNLVASWQKSYLNYMPEPGVSDTFSWNLDDYVMGVDVQQLVTRDNTIYDYKDGKLKSISLLDGTSLQYTDNGVYSPTTDTAVTYQRDPVGRITKVIAPDETFYSYQYNSRGDLVKVTDPMGAATEYTYDSEHNLIDIKDARGIKPIKNEYDDSGRLIANTDADGNRIEYTHSLSAKQEVVKDRLGRISVYEYDENGMVTSITDPIGAITRYEYGEIGGRKTFDGQTMPVRRVKTADIDAMGHRTEYAYDNNGNVTSKTDALGHTQRWQYDDYNQLTAEWDALGHKTSYEYNEKGQKVSQTDALGNVSRWVYDQYWMLWKEIDALGNETEYTYDDYRNVYSITRFAQPGGDPIVNIYNYGIRDHRLGAEADPNNHNTNYYYDANGRMIKTTNHLLGETKYEYDALGNQTKVIDPLGRETINEYNERGELVKTTYPDGTFTTTVYDAEGNRIESRDQLNRATQYFYDSAKRLVKTVFPDGAETRTTYDISGRRIASTDALGNVTNYEYNEIGQLIRQRDALGHEISYEYDAIGNRTSMTDPKGNTTLYYYDALNRQVRTQYPDNSQTFTEYDALGRKIAETDQAGVRTAFEFDSLGRLTAVVGPASSPGSGPMITRYEYDPAGNRTAIIDAENRRTEFEYDELNRLSLKRLPMGQTETYIYNAVGSMTSKTDFNGDTITYTYDNMNRLTQKQKDSSNTDYFEYTATGKRLRATSNRVGASIVNYYYYDTRDRVTKIGQPAGILEYEYDLNSNKMRMTQTAYGNTEEYGRYEYDSLNRLSAAIDDQGRRTEYEYDENGNRESITYPNGTKTTYEYNSLNRLIYMENKNINTGELITSYGYTLGPTGIRLAIEESNSSGLVANMNYNYDNLYRLTKETRTGTNSYSIEYTYDKVGNRLTQDAGGIVTDYTYDAADRLLQTQSPTETTTYSYDDNGNTISKTDNQGTTAYVYDYENRLVRSSESWGSPKKILVYYYNADGIRVFNYCNNPSQNLWNTIDFVQPYAQVIEEKDSITSKSVKYFFGDDLISMDRTLAGGSVSYYHYDGLGSTRALTNSSASITDTYDFYAFGNLLSSTGTTVNYYLFTGEQYDPNIGFYYFRARYMNPDIGRFISVDIIVGSEYDPMSFHKYLYCINNPLNHIDLSGNSLLSIIELSIVFICIVIILSVTIIPVYRAKHRSITWLKRSADEYITNYGYLYSNLKELKDLLYVYADNYTKITQLMCEEAAYGAFLALYNISTPSIYRSIYRFHAWYGIHENALVLIPSIYWPQPLNAGASDRFNIINPETWVGGKEEDIIALYPGSLPIMPFTTIGILHHRTNSWIEWKGGN